mmetsp:Transcript_18579/g.42730  ORF Transcript_18579/g.42730 Transcript_18579/m.42730 type:complete len:220 (-) Transcript_18579:582-1241(-)
MPASSGFHPYGSVLCGTHTYRIGASLIRLLAHSLVHHVYRGSGAVALPSRMDAAPRTFRKSLSLSLSSPPSPPMLGTRRVRAMPIPSSSCDGHPLSLPLPLPLPPPLLLVLSHTTLAVTDKASEASRMDRSQAVSAIKKFPDDRTKLTGKDSICAMGILAPMSRIDDDGSRELRTVTTRDDSDDVDNADESCCCCCFCCCVPSLRFESSRSSLLLPEGR